MHKLLLLTIVLLVICGCIDERSTWSSSHVDPEVRDANAQRAHFKTPRPFRGDYPTAKNRHEREHRGNVLGW